MRLLGGEAAPTAGLRPRWSDLIPDRRASLEDAICRLMGFDGIEITGSGTAALVIAFEYLARLRPERRTIVVPGYTCPLVVLAAAARGLRCIACDTVADGFDLDLEALGRVIGRDTLAIVPTHYGGALTNVARVRAAAAAVSPDIAIVEDAAQAFGATKAGRSVGLEGDIGIFSFGAGKGFTVYEGGALVARDRGTLAGLRAVAAELSRPTLLAELKRQALLVGYHAAYGPLGLRLAYGMPKRYRLWRGQDMHAAGDIFDPDIPLQPVGRWRRAVGAAALQRLPGHLVASRCRFDALTERLARAQFMNRTAARMYPPRPGECPTATSLFLTLPDGSATAACIDRLWESPLGVARMFSRAIGDYPALVPTMLPAETPNAKRHARQTITMSTSLGAGPEPVEMAIDVIEAYLGQPEMTDRQLS